MEISFLPFYVLLSDTISEKQLRSSQSKAYHWKTSPAYRS
nr:MAG TPA: hypothetical protein [Caudoviricetes sp.]